MIPKERHKTFEELRQLVSAEVFQDHTYLYTSGYKNEKEDGPSFLDESKEGQYEEIPAQYSKGNDSFPVALRIFNFKR